MLGDGVRIFTDQGDRTVREELLSVGSTQQARGINQMSGKSGAAIAVLMIGDNRAEVHYHRDGGKIIVERIEAAQQAVGLHAQKCAAGIRDADASDAKIHVRTSRMWAVSPQVGRTPCGHGE
jgi:hypothetical protein